MNTRFLIFTIFVMAFVATTCMGKSLSNGKDKKQMAARSLKSGLKQRGAGNLLNKRSFNLRSYKAALLAKRRECPDGLVEFDDGICVCVVTNDPDVPDEVRCNEDSDLECPRGYYGDLIPVDEDEDRRRRHEDDEDESSESSSSEEKRRRRGEDEDEDEDWSEDEDDEDWSEDEDDEDWSDDEDDEDWSEDEDEDDEDWSEDEDRSDERRRVRRGESEEGGDAVLVCLEDDSEDRRRK